MFTTSWHGVELRFELAFVRVLMPHQGARPACAACPCFPRQPEGGENVFGAPALRLLSLAPPPPVLTPPGNAVLKGS